MVRSRVTLTLNQNQFAAFQDILVLYKIDGILKGSGKRRRDNLQIYNIWVVNYVASSL